MGQRERFVHALHMNQRFTFPPIFWLILLNILCPDYTKSTLAMIFNEKRVSSCTFQVIV